MSGPVPSFDQSDEAGRRAAIRDGPTRSFFLASIDKRGSPRGQVLFHLPVEVAKLLIPAKATFCEQNVFGVFSGNNTRSNRQRKTLEGVEFT